MSSMMSAGGTVHVKVPLLSTFLDDVADGLCAEGVIQRNHHQGVRVTGHLGDGPLAVEASINVKDKVQVNQSIMS